MRRFKFNDNPLSNCTLKHTPYNESDKEKYAEIQTRILRANELKEYGFNELGRDIDYLFPLLAQDVDYALSSDDLESIARELSTIRINDRAITGFSEHNYFENNQ